MVDPRNPKECPLCEKNASITESRSNFTYFIECKRCGNYTITEEMIERLVPRNDFYKHKYLLSGLIRENTIKKMRPIFLSTKTGISLIDDLRRLSITDKAFKLLNNIVNMTEYPGQQISINNADDYPFAYVNDEGSLHYFLNYLFDHGYIKGLNPWIVTVEGFNKVEELKIINLESDKAYVAMHFIDKMYDVYDSAIEPAIISCGYKPYRVDRDPDNEKKIDDKIFANIKEARFLIADFTGQRPAVYFEAGFAGGLGIPVIRCCKEAQVDKLCFDTRQYPHLLWKDAHDLKEMLIDRIRATIGLEPHFEL